MSVSANHRRLLIVTGIFPPDHGGPATYVPAIASALSDTWKVVAVVTLSDETSTSDDLPYKVRRIKRNQPRWKRFLQTVKILYTLSREADVVFLNGLVLEGVIASKYLCGKPIVTKVVGDLIWEKAHTSGRTALGISEFQSERLTPYWRGLHALQGWYVRQSDYVITPSRYLRLIVAGWGVPSDRVKVIPNALQLDIKMSLPGAATYDLVSAGRLVPVKGFSALINLAVKNSWSLKIIGDGPDRGALEQQIRELSAETLITLVGAVSAKDVIGHIQSAKLFVLNSEHEGFPHVVLEAKIAGVPVVANRVGGIPEMIDDGINGCLVSKDKLGELEATVRRLLESRAEREALVCQGFNQLRRDYAFTPMVGSTDSVLRAAIACN